MIGREFIATWPTEYAPPIQSAMLAVDRSRLVCMVSGIRGSRPRRFSESDGISRKFDILATLCLLGTILCWGTAPVMLKYLVDYIPDGYTTNLVRYPVGTLPYVPLLIAAMRRRDLGRFWLAALIPATVNIVGQTLWAWAPYFMGVALLGFLFRLGVIWGMLATFVLFPDERRLIRSRRFWSGALLALAGFGVMVFKDGAWTANATWTGVVIMLVCGLCYGLYGVSIRYVMRDLNPLLVFGTVGLYTSIGIVFMAPLGEPSSLGRIGPAPWIALIVSALVGISAAHGLYYVAVKRVGVAISVLTLTAAPFVTAVTAAICVNEHLTTREWFGGIVLTIGALLAVWSQKELSEHSPSSEHVVSLGVLEAPEEPPRLRGDTR